MTNSDESEIGINFRALDLDRLPGQVVVEVIQAASGIFLLLSSGEIVLIENFKYDKTDLLHDIESELRASVAAVRRHGRLSRVRKALKVQIKNEDVEIKDVGSGPELGNPQG